jgi:hypothetical protein
MPELKRSRFNLKAADLALRPLRQEIRHALAPLTRTFSGDRSQ